MGLTNKQQVFVNEYLQCWNATEAARRAGYAHPNVQGPRLLVNVSVAAEIQAKITEKAMSANEVLVHLADIARGDMGDFLEFKDGIKTPYLDLKGAYDAGLFRLVKKFKYDATGRPEVELYDRMAALLNIGRHHGLFKETNLNIDVSRLTDAQLERIANGENPLAVIGDKGAGGTGTPATEDDES